MIDRGIEANAVRVRRSAHDPSIYILEDQTIRRLSRLVLCTLKYSAVGGDILSGRKQCFDDEHFHPETTISVRAGVKMTW